MKIVLLQPFLSYGGAEAVSIQQAYHLAKNGYNVQIITLYIKEGRLPFLADRVDIILPPKFVQKLFERNYLFLLIFGFPLLLFLTIINLSGTGIINPHNFPSLWVAGIISRFKKTCIVWTCHNLPQNPFSKNFPAGFLFDFVEVINKFFAKRCDNIFAVSSKVQLQLKKLYGVKSKVLHPAIEYEFYSKGKRERVRNLYKLENKIVILQIARLNKEKNHELSIFSLQKVLKKFPKAVLVFVGDGREEKGLKKIVVKLGLKNKVIFTGYKSPAEIRDFYVSADLHIVPSYKTEGFNLSPLEALSVGTVSVVAKNSGVDEILEGQKIGLVAKPEVEDFSAKIIYALSNRKKLEKMGTDGSKWVLKNLSWDVYIRNFLKWQKN